MKRLFLVCLLLLVSLFASNSYANEFPVLGLLAFPEDGCFDVKEDGQCTWFPSEGAWILTAEQKIKELIALRRQIDVKLEELLHQKMEGKEAEEENLFEIFTTLFELIELESAIDMRIEERQQG